MNAYEKRVINGYFWATMFGAALSLAFGQPLYAVICCCVAVLIAVIEVVADSFHRVLLTFTASLIVSKADWNVSTQKEQHESGN